MISNMKSMTTQGINRVKTQNYVHNNRSNSIDIEKDQNEFLWIMDSYR